MIEVLQDWLEIGEANKILNRKRLPIHEASDKNWDLYRVYTIVESMPREKKIIDLGCGDAFALKLLYAMGFKSLYGIDFSINWRARVGQITRMWRARSLKVPYRLYKGDLTTTKFSARTFDVALGISVIEHGVNLEKFLIESFRILKPGGLLFITNDYWEEEIQINASVRPYGLSWKIFSKQDIEHFIKLSYDVGFFLYRDSPFPKCSDRCIVWKNHEYTFLNIVLKKKA